MTKHQDLNRTFARRIGKKLSNLKKSLLEEDLPKYEFDPIKLNQTKFEKIFLEVGFGMGEHFIHQIKTNPNNLYIGVEVYLNGVANVLKYVKEHNVDNCLIWADDFDLISKKLPVNLLDGIYILFPDPWHKKRYMKKRIFEKNRISLIKEKLKNGGFISFASDIDDYFESAKILLESDQSLNILNNNYNIPHENYIETKYHKKAITENRNPQFITAYFKK